eukprot:4082133-Alexandrium_andersonii.AAC.1
MCEGSLSKSTEATHRPWKTSRPTTTETTTNFSKSREKGNTMLGAVLACRPGVTPPCRVACSGKIKVNQRQYKRGTPEQKATTTDD